MSSSAVRAFPTYDAASPRRSNSRWLADVLPPLTRLAEHVALGNPHVGHEDTRSCRGCAARWCGIFRIVEPGSVIGNEDQAEPLVPILAGARQHRDHGARQMGTGAPDLVPVEDPLVAVQDSRRTNCRRVRAGLGLGDRDAELAVPAQVDGQVLRLLLGAFRGATMFVAVNMEVMTHAAVSRLNFAIASQKMA